MLACETFWGHCVQKYLCDKASLDIFWLKDESLEASDNLPDPDVIALEIVDDLEAALEQFREASCRGRGGRVSLLS